MGWYSRLWFRHYKKKYILVGREDLSVVQMAARNWLFCPPEVTSELIVFYHTGKWRI